MPYSVFNLPFNVSFFFGVSENKKLNRIGFKAWGVKMTLTNTWIFLLSFEALDTMDAVLFFFFYDFLGTIVPIIVTAYSYYKVHIYFTNIKKYLPFSGFDSNKIMILILIPIVCYLPQILMNLYMLFVKETPPSGIVFIVSMLRRLWALLNLLNYWFMMPSKKEGKIGEVLIRQGDETSMIVY